MNTMQPLHDVCLATAGAATNKVGPGVVALLALLIILFTGQVASPAQSPVPGDLVINEVLADPAPDLLGDANGDGIRDASEDEFIEIVNVSGSVVDISGLTVSDEVQTRHIFSPGTILPPLCSIVVFGGGTPTGPFGGALVQTASSGMLAFSNFGDTATLEDGGTEITSFTYGPTGCEGDQDQSVALDPDLTGLCNLHSLIAASGGALHSPGTKTDGSTFELCETPLFADGFESGDAKAWSSASPAPVP